MVCRKVDNFARKLRWNWLVSLAVMVIQFHTAKVCHSHSSLLASFVFVDFWDPSVGFVDANCGLLLFGMEKNNIPSINKPNFFRFFFINFYFFMNLRGVLGIEYFSFECAQALTLSPLILMVVMWFINKSYVNGDYGYFAIS